jgi:hypothetical protein
MEYEEEEPLMMKTMKEEPMKVNSESKTWICSSCTLENFDFVFWCDVCSNMKPYVEPKSIKKSPL